MPEAYRNLSSAQLEAIQQRLALIESLLPNLEKEIIALQTQQTQNTTHQTKSNHFDLVTEADLHSEKTLTTAIAKRFPKDAILSEEGTDRKVDQGNDYTWVIDPIDGTVNYANGLHHWGISVGIISGQTVVGGIVSAPALNLRYRALYGNGATRNGIPITVSTKDQLSKGVIVTGFPYDRAQRAEPLSRALANFLKVAGGVRRFGAASIDFCLVADGTLIGYYEMQLKPWDMAAGLLIAREAGAKITDFKGKAIELFESHGVVVANPKIHAAMLPLTAPMLEAIAIDTQ
ncbi:MAG: inositol monophosphatase [Puniceicoccaceae bacterium]|nr:MAG: inositol monophosphatase [Puniceicoccaceae bacterium]